MGKLFVISELLSKVNYANVEEFLFNIFHSRDQVFFVPFVNSNNLPLSAMSGDQIEAGTVNVNVEILVRF